MATSTLPGLQTLGNYSAANSAALSFGGNPNVGAGGGTYGVPQGMSYATGQNLTGMQNNIPGTYQTNQGNVTIGGSSNSNTTPYGPPAPQNTSSNSSSQSKPSTPSNNPYPNFQPTDEWARANTGMSLAQFYQQHPQYNQPQGISQADLDNAYAPVFSDIQNLYNTAQNNQQTYLNAATSPFDALQPGIDQAYTQGQNLNQQQTAQNNTQTQNALAAARQLYNELQQGVQQRFGGTTSAGDFAKAFYGRQLQQNEGSAYNTAGQNQQQLATQMQNIQAQHDSATQQLAAQKASALSNAQLQFQQMLQQIDSLKTQTDQQKAASKLDALNQLNQTANAIQQQFNQFQQNLQLQNQSALDQLRNGVATAQAYSGQPINLSSIAQFTAPQIGGGQTSQGTNPYLSLTGNVNPTNKNQFGFAQ